jgi:hypothetical protein
MPQSAKPRKARRLPDWLSCLGLLLLGALLTLPYSGPNIRPHYDGLFYEAQKREVQGESRHEALRQAFSTPMAEELKADETDLEPSQRKADNPEWAEYSSQFYRRRWTVPVMAAALDPIFGERSLEEVALIAWALLPAILFLLLRRRFRPGMSAAVAVFCTMLPPVFQHGHLPVTDSWGLTLLVTCLLLAMLIAERGRRWLPVFIAAVLALSFTRDLTIVVVIATAWVAFSERSREWAAIAGSAFLASLPAPLIFDAPLRQSLAYTFNDFRIPTDDSWSSILSLYPGELKELLRQDVLYPGVSPIPTPITIVMGMLVFAGLYCLLVPWRQRDPFLSMIRASAVAGVITILITVNYTGLRLEMVFVPAIAIGLALLGERMIAARDRRVSTTPARAPA